MTQEQRICLCELTGGYHVVDRDSHCEMCPFPRKTKPFAVATVNEAFTNCLDEINRLRALKAQFVEALEQARSEIRR